jgi:hypothetical protein
MGGRKVTVQDAMQYCKNRGSCSEAELAYIFGLSPSSAYHMFKILKELCRDGFLNTGGLKCEVVGDRIVLSKAGEGK